MGSNKVRYSEETCRYDATSTNAFYLWDDSVEIYQIINSDLVNTREALRWSKDEAIRYAKMILERYEEKDKGEPELKNYFHEIEKVAKAAGDAARDGYLWGRG